MICYGVKHRGPPEAMVLVLSRQLAISICVTVINPAVSCHYFPSGLWLFSQPQKMSLFGHYHIILFGDSGIGKVTLQIHATGATYGTLFRTKLLNNSFNLGTSSINDGVER